MKRILCYGDSNVWGNTPEGIRTQKRWTKLLDSNFEIIEDGINGRSTIYEDYKPCRNGLEALGYTLIAQKPLDMIIILIGVNDLKFTDAKTSSQNLGKILDSILDADEIYPSAGCHIFNDGYKVLVVSPIWLNEKIEQDVNNKLASKVQEAKLLSKYYKEEAEKRDCYFLEVNDQVKTNDVDFIHLDQENHQILAKLINDKIKEIMPV